MQITVTSGSGRGKTAMAAFDDALNQAGIANYNLIKLSSIIPPQTDIILDKYQSELPDEYGNRLYTVLAEMRTDEPNKTVGAGIGWYQWGDNRGVFVENHQIMDGLDKKEMEKRVKENLEQTVLDLCEFRSIPMERSAIKTLIRVGEAKNEPTSVLVAAVYKSESWVSNEKSEVELLDQEKISAETRYLKRGKKAIRI